MRRKIKWNVYMLTDQADEAPIELQAFIDELGLILQICEHAVLYCRQGAAAAAAAAAATFTPATLGVLICKRHIGAGLWRLSLSQRWDRLLVAEATAISQLAFRARGRRPGGT